MKPRSSNKTEPPRRESEEIRRILEDSEQRVREFFEEVAHPQAAARVRKPRRPCNPQAGGQLGS